MARDQKLDSVLMDPGRWPAIPPDLQGLQLPTEPLKALSVYEMISFHLISNSQGFSRSSVGKESACNAGDPALIPGLGRTQRRKWQPTPIFLP